MNLVKIHTLLALAGSGDQGRQTLRRLLLVKMVGLEDARRRFFQKVVKTETCWLWTASKIKGYGQCHRGAGKLSYSHRWLYELIHGPVPKGLECDHKCRNPSCVNPDHIELVTHKQNVNFGLSPLTSRTPRPLKSHCKHGHPYNDENTKFDNTGRRFCVVCRRRSQVAWLNRKRGIDRIYEH